MPTTKPINTLSPSLTTIPTPSISPTLTETEANSGQDLTPNSFPQFEVSDINLTTTPTPTPTIKMSRAIIIIKTPTPTPTSTIVVSGLTTSARTYSVDISFQTNRPYSSKIYYGEQRNPGLTVPISQPTISHFHRLSGLEGGTTYYFQIKLYPSPSSGSLLYQSQDYSFRTQEAKRVRLTLRTVQVLKDGNSSGPGTFRLYLGVRDPANPDFVSCCGYLQQFSTSENEIVNINKTYMGGGAEHGTPLTVFMYDNYLNNQEMLNFSFDAPLTGPDQSFTKTITSEEKYNRKFKATFFIEIFDD